jgi:hypothetical protein
VWKPEDVVLKRQYGPYLAECNKGRADKVGAVSKPNPGRRPELPTSAACCGMECQLKTKFSIAIREPRVLIKTCRATYAGIPNLNPFDVNGHWLPVPVSVGRDEVSFPHVLQEISEPVLLDILEMAAAVLGSAVMLHNSPGAGASQNHLHQHMIFRTLPLPIEGFHRAETKRRAHLVNYPAGVLVYPLDFSDALWRLINNLQTEGVPFNLILASGFVYCIGRRRRHEVGSVYQKSILAGSEYGGHWIVPDLEALDSINEAIIGRALEEGALTVTELLQYA